MKDNTLKDEFYNLNFAYTCCNDNEYPAFSIAYEDNEEFKTGWEGNAWVKENVTDFKVVITEPRYHMVMDKKENLVRKMDEKHTV